MIGVLYGNEWYLQEDKIPVHTRKAAKAEKSKLVPSRIDWLPNSPDLAPIENLWGVMKSRFVVCNPKTVSNLRENIQDIWESFDPEFVRKFCSSMHNSIDLYLGNPLKK